MALKVGMLTSGGDAQGLNPAMRGVSRALWNNNPTPRFWVFLTAIMV